MKDYTYSLNKNDNRWEVYEWLTTVPGSDQIPKLITSLSTEKRAWRKAWHMLFCQSSYDSKTPEPKRVDISIVTKVIFN